MKQIKVLIGEEPDGNGGWRPIYMTIPTVKETDEDVSERMLAERTGGTE